MEATQEVEDKGNEEVISDKTSEKQETRDEILARHRWLTL